jgi:hypothetical protein
VDLLDALVRVHGKKLSPAACLLVTGVGIHPYGTHQFSLPQMIQLPPRIVSDSFTQLFIVAAVMTHIAASCKANRNKDRV